MTEDNAPQTETQTTALPNRTRLVGLDTGDLYASFDGYKPFRLGERIPVDPPGTVAIVRGSRTVETKGGELVLEYVVQLERPGNDVGQS